MTSIYISRRRSAEGRTIRRHHYGDSHALGYYRQSCQADVAMTGEITLRGRVLPIGGLKEKLLAAKVIGIKTVCIPKDNEKDLEEISKEITDGMEIVPVEKFSQVEKIAFVK